MFSELFLCAAAVVQSVQGAGPETGGKPVDYAAEVAPLFAAKCVACHGPEKQKNGLRLDVPSSVVQGGDRGPAVIAGKSAESLLFQAVAGTHDKLRMPPEGERLSPAEVAMMAAWIDQGAKVPESASAPVEVKTEHWAFRPIHRPEPPAVQAKDWVRTPIDAFVLGRLEQSGITPAPEADRDTLIRRLYLDLLGLPPSPEEVAGFVNDSSPYAYEQLVSRLLASPHFGERWGRHWLDLARYADSDGYEKDTGRPNAFRYRDWVIDAINRDLPYDEFVVEQLAGDLLPNATTNELLATGFHRNTLTNKEGGVDPEEDRVKQAVDRTNTTGAVFLGLTVGCAQCHSHKYDPISQREYYSLYAFFNAALESDVPAPRPGEREAYAATKQTFDAEVARVQQQVDEYRPELAKALPEWEKTIDPAKQGWDILSPGGFLSEGGAAFEKLEDESLLLGGASPLVDTYTITAVSQRAGVRAFRLQALTHDTLTKQGPGRAHNGNFVLSEFKVFAAPADKPDEKVEVKLASVTADFEEPGHEAADAIDGDPNTGWAIYREAAMNEDRRALFMAEAPAGYPQGTIFTFVLQQSYGRNHNIGRLRLSVTAEDPATINFPDSVFAALRVPAEQRTPEQAQAVLEYYGTFDPKMRALQTTLEALRKSEPKPPATLGQTLARNPTPPKTFVQLRGDFLSPGDEVQPGVPAFLHALKPRGGAPDRLDLARWIVDSANPLTCRVEMNRIWEHLLGAGLARTSEDFGVRGELPTHPELLDWLADEFMRQGWSRKQMIRLIVQSATYRQASTGRPELKDVDPANHLLARQNRFRVEAEITRDLLLAASGLLNPAIGGPSVRPGLPAGYSNLGYANSVQWPETQTDEKYRRGLYIWFQRTIAYPMLMTFDCPDSNVTALKRNRSNTPLQALTLMNDPVLFECAQAFGRRMAGWNLTPEACLRQAFELCFARAPQARELDALLALYQDQAGFYQQHPEEAVKLAGNYAPEGVASEVAAAHIVLARTLMNLDEFVTRE